MQIKEIMTKGIACVDSKSSAADAARKMKDQNVGTVLVIDGNSVKGLLTDRSITTKAVAEQKDPRNVPVTDIMTKKVVGCSENDDLFDALKIMGENKIRRLPVINDQSQLVGIVSLSDIAQEMRVGLDSIFDEMTKSNK